MKTSNLYLKGTWQEVIDDCRATVSKSPLGKEPSEKFKREILIAEHSPIRDISFRWKWIGIKSWIATHFCRHHWECRISTQRTDRTGVNRDNLPQSALVNFTGEANVQHLIDTMRKRLCYQASPETREYAEDLKESIGELDKHIANVLVPNCVYRCGCPEMKSCGLWTRFRYWAIDKDLDVTILPIDDRYVLYNEFFRETREKQ